MQNHGAKVGYCILKRETWRNCLVWQYQDKDEDVTERSKKMTQTAHGSVTQCKIIWGATLSVGDVSAVLNSDINI